MPDGSPSEKETFQQWQRILSSQETVTVDNIRDFCIQQLKDIDGQLENIENTPGKTQKLALLRTVYSKLLKSLDAPQTERESLELYLKGLLGEK